MQDKKVEIGSETDVTIKSDDLPLKSGSGHKRRDEPHDRRPSDGTQDHDSALKSGSGFKKRESEGGDDFAMKSGSGTKKRESEGDHKKRTSEDGSELKRIRGLQPDSSGLKIQHSIDEHLDFGSWKMTELENGRPKEERTVTVQGRSGQQFDFDSVLYEASKTIPDTEKNVKPKNPRKISRDSSGGSSIETPMEKTIGIEDPEAFERRIARSRSPESRGVISKSLSETEKFEKAKPDGETVFEFLQSFHQQTQKKSPDKGICLLMLEMI